MAGFSHARTHGVAPRFVFYGFAAGLIRRKEIPRTQSARGIPMWASASFIAFGTSTLKQGKGYSFPTFMTSNVVSVLTNTSPHFTHGVTARAPHRGVHT